MDYTEENYLNLEEQDQTYSFYQLDLRLKYLDYIDNQKKEMSRIVKRRTAKLDEKIEQAHQVLELQNAFRQLL